MWLATLIRNPGYYAVIKAHAFAHLNNANLPIEGNIGKGNYCEKLGEMH